MNKKIIIGLALLVFFLVLTWSGASFYPDWLWFKNLGYSPVFWTMILSKFGLGSVVWLVFISIMALNLYVANRLKPRTAKEDSFKLDESGAFPIPLSGAVINKLIILFFLIASFFIASKGAYSWDMVLRFFYQQPFGSTDPIFGRDIGFYVFSLPFYTFVQKGLLIFFFFAGLVAVWWYLKEGILNIIDEYVQAQGQPVSLPKMDVAQPAKKHFLILGIIIALLLAWGFHLKVYGLLYSTIGAAFGASYTDVHVKIPGYRVLIFASLGLAVIFVLEFFKSRKKLILISLAVWLAAFLLVWNLLPPGGSEIFSKTQ